MKKYTKKSQKRNIEVTFWFYDDGKNFLPLVISPNSGLTKDEQTCITIMQCGGHVHKQKATLIFD
jgi:hypothetical protein